MSVRSVFGLLYDRQERTFPFRWRAGHMTVLKGPDGQRQPADVPDRNINARGDIVGNVYGLAAKDFDALRRIDPVMWRCAFGG